ACAGSGGRGCPGADRSCRMGASSLPFRFYKRGWAPSCRSARGTRRDPAWALAPLAPMPLTQRVGLGPRASGQTGYQPLKRPDDAAATSARYRTSDADPGSEMSSVALYRSMTGPSAIANASARGPRPEARGLKSVALELNPPGGAPLRAPEVRV